MSIERILVIRFSSLGDIILLTPLFREIKKRFANAKLDFLTTSTFETVCQDNPNLDSILSFDRKQERPELNRVISLIKNSHYDLILDAHHSLRSRIILLNAFGPLYPFKPFIRRIDKRSWKRNLLLLLKINLLQQAVSQREAYCHLLPFDPAAGTSDQSTELYPAAKDHERITAILHQFGGEGKTLVALGPGASFPGKCWSKENYLALTKRLLKANLSIVLLGGPGDSEPAWIAKECSQNILNVAGKLSFLETAAMLKRCQLSVSNDSAIVHFSEAVGTPSIAIFGPTVREFGYAPYLEHSETIERNLSCRPCSRNGKGFCHNPIVRQCLTEISVDRVYYSVCNYLKIKYQAD